MRILNLFDQSMLTDSEYSLRSCAIVSELREMAFDTQQIVVNLGDINSDIDNESIGVSEDSSILIDGIDFHFINLSGLFSNIPILNYCREFFQLRGTLKKIVDNFNPQIIHVHSPAILGLAALQVANANNIPLLYEIRTLLEEDDNEQGKLNRLTQQLLLRLESRVIRHANAVTIISENLRHALLERGAHNDKVSVVANAGLLKQQKEYKKADQNKLGADDLKRQLGLEQKTLLGYVGMFHPHEGVHLILQSLPILLQGVPELHLLLVGSGPEEAALKHLAAELGLSGQITFAGKIENEKLEQYFEIIDVLVYPRISTPMTEKVAPFIPLQAMASGRVVLASDVGGHNDIIQHGDNGYLFPNGDKSALADAVVDVLNEKPAWPYIRERSISYIREKRNWINSVTNYKKIYSSIVLHEDA